MKIEHVGLTGINGSLVMLENVINPHFDEMVRFTLSDGSESIERIAELLGFCDGAYFSRFFKRQTGLSPSAYRFRAHAP